MSKKFTKVEKSILKGIEEAVAYRDGKIKNIKSHKFPQISEDIDVRSIRKKLNMTQEEFTQFGFSVSAIRHWESHRRIPEGPARILLKIIEHHPEIVLDHSLLIVKN